ncbi:MAG TPA: hypothetical protein VIJ75_16095 [Hanamia sp.]
MKKQNTKWILIVMVVISSTIPILLYLYKFGSFSFSKNQGQWATFADYLGGTLGIVLSAVTIYLLYQTYTTQNSQLKIQENDSHINFIDLQYNQIIKDISGIRFANKKGSEALYAWIPSEKNPANNVVNTLNFILHTFNSHIDTISSMDIDASRKQDLFCRAYLMFHAKIIWPALSSLYNDQAFKGHTDNLYKNFNDLIRKTYCYLVPREKLEKPTDERILVLLKNCF